MLQSGFDVCCLALAFQGRDERGLGVAGMGFDSDDDHIILARLNSTELFLW